MATARKAVTSSTWRTSSRRTCGRWAMFGAYPGPAPLNVAGGVRTTLNTLVGMLGEILGVTPMVNYVDARSGEVHDSHADIGTIRSVMGYAPHWTVRAGLEALVASTGA